MKIGIIARGLTEGGVTRYIKNILEVFDSSFSVQHSFVLFTDREDFINIYKNIRVIYIKKSNKIFWDYFKILPYFLNLNLDVVLYPKNIIPFTHVVYRFKKVNVIHDLAYFDKSINAYKFFDTLYMKLFMRLSCLISDVVIAISQSTKKDIEKILKISSHKIVVIYEGVEDKFRRQTDEVLMNRVLFRYKISQPFLFYCGSLSPRKNILRTLIVFNGIKNQISHNIYLSGGKSWNDEDVKKYIKDNLSDRVFLIGKVSDSELVCLYSAADLYLYPSLYEGFGLPILEAQACGCPVLTSNTTSCPEVVGDGACVVNPYSEDEIKNGILKILSDEKYKNRLIKNGLENIKRFSWGKTANKILEEIK